MAKVIVRLYSNLKELAQTGRVEVEAENVGGALNSIVTKFGSKFSQMLYDQEKSKNGDPIVRNCFSLVVNSEVIGFKGLEKKELKEGDMIHIFPPIAGGS